MWRDDMDAVPSLKTLDSVPNYAPSGSEAHVPNYVPEANDEHKCTLLCLSCSILEWRSKRLQLANL